MKNSKLLVVVDMQNDFIDGSLGTAEAQAIVPNVVKKIQEWDGEIISTFDCHYYDYMKTNEGKHLPVPHCIKGSRGYEQYPDVVKALKAKADEMRKHTIAPYRPVTWRIDKLTFGSTALPEMIRGMGMKYIELVGLCTDICVVSNALILKAHYPELTIAVDPACCAGVTPESHQAALTTMKMCQIEIL